MADSIPDRPSDETDSQKTDPRRSINNDSEESKTEKISLKSASVLSSQNDGTDPAALVIPTSNPNAADINVNEPTILSNSPPFDIIVNDNLRSTEQISIPEPIAQAGSLPIGATIGHFRITKYIGGGGMGRVYEGIDLALDRKVAIKILPRQRAQDQASVARFLNEAKSAARLNHEHIAQVYFCGEENGIPYIAFEYVQGVNLRHYVSQRGILPLTQSINFLLQISSALSHAAVHGVTHRDVKPSNILITPQGKAKLIDMGLARLLRPSDPEEELTVSGVTLGTFDYISPEQARDPRLADVRSDIYSLGCTFFFMMTGQPPFPEGTVLQKLLKHQGDQPPDIRKFVPETPAEVVAVMQKMMAKDPQDRYQTPDELIADLIRVAEQIGLRPTEAGKMNWGTPKGTKRRIFLHHLPWISAVLLLFLAAAVYYFSAHTGRKSDLLPPSALRSSKTGSSSELLLSVKGASEADVPLPDHLAAEEIPRLSPRPLPPRDRIRGIGNEFAASEKTAVTMTMVPRLAGGLGIAPVSSNDLSGNSELHNLSPQAVKAVELTAVPETDSFSDSWSPFRRMSVPFQSSVEETLLPEGTDPVVDGIGKKAGYYTTLEEAVAHASERSRGDSGAHPKEVAVKLAFNGDLIVSSTTLTDCDIRLTAAAGFTPRLVFHPRETAGIVPPSALFTLRRARLTLANLAILFDVTSQEMISDEWSMIRLDPFSSLNLTDSFLTIRNQTVSNPVPYHPEVAFFRCGHFPQTGKPNLPGAFETPLPFPSVPLPSGSEEMVSTGERTRPRGETSLESFPSNGGALTLHRTFLRGEATLLSVRSVPNVRLEMTSSAFVLDGPAVHYEDYSAQSSLDSVFLTVTWDRLLGWSRSPLFRVVRQSLACGDFGKEINASIAQSLLILSDHPIGEITFSVPKEGNYPSPDWKTADTILINVPSLVRYRFAERKETYRDIPLNAFGGYRMETLSPEWSLFKETPPHRVTLGNLEHDLIQPIEKNHETEKQRSVLSSLENDFIAPLRELFGESGEQPAPLP